MAGGDKNVDDIKIAEVVLPAKPFADTLSFFTDKLGFRTDSIYPADAPRIAVISGFGIRLRLDSGAVIPSGRLRLLCAGLSETTTQTAPNGTLVEIVPVESPLILPPNRPTLVVSQKDAEHDWVEGRAGMQYRDLIPDRFGGRFIASHIRIPVGGPVPDYVHHHHIHFQMIYCVRGWVRVVYEDQGPPMTMEAGDCFLQPPHIRHRVLECSDNMEVVEISCPAEHETCVDHDMVLPTAEPKSDREFAGQHFTFHQAENAQWLPYSVEGFECRNIGIEEATAGIASAVVVRSSGDTGVSSLEHSAEIQFLFVLQGSAVLGDEKGMSWHLQADDSCAFGANFPCGLTEISSDFTMLEVCIPSR